MSGHEFVRPGQVAPHLPPPDNCMACGQPEASHRSAAGMAEVVAGRALLGDFQRAAHEYSTGAVAHADWLVWALRLGQHLQHLADAVSQPEPRTPVVAAPGSYVAGDGSAWLTAGDVHTVRLALLNAAETASPATAAAYESLRLRLGDGR